MATNAKARSKTTVLLPGSRRTLTRDEVVARGFRRLKRLIGETCLWPGTIGHDWKVGDHAFLILEFERVKGTPLYVQVWSEAGEPVGVEVVSGHVSPSAKHFIGKSERRALGELGFTISGRAGNFSKLASMQTPDDAAALARNFLDIVYDVLGYRGRHKLVVKQGWGERARREPVYDALTPMDFVKLLIPFNYESRLDKGMPEPWGVLRHHPTRATSMMRFMWKVPDSEELFASVRLSAILPKQVGALRPTLADLNTINDSVRFVRLAVDEDGDLALSMDVRFDGGVTVTYIGRCLGMWEQARRFVRRELRRLVAQSKRADPDDFMDDNGDERPEGQDEGGDDSGSGRGGDGRGVGSSSGVGSRGRGALVVH